MITVLTAVPNGERETDIIVLLLHVQYIPVYLYAMCIDVVMRTIKQTS